MKTTPSLKIKDFAKWTSPDEGIADAKRPKSLTAEEEEENVTTESKETTAQKSKSVDVKKERLDPEVEVGGAISFWFIMEQRVTSLFAG